MYPGRRSEHPPPAPSSPSPPDDIHHVCLRVLECVCVCVHNSFLSFVQKKHPRILKHFGFCILKCFISFSPLIFFIPFIQNWKSNFFFFFSDIFSWHPLFSSTAQPSVVDLAAAWKPCTAQHINRLLSGRTDGQREREKEWDLQPASGPTWTHLWNNFHAERVSCCDD